MNIKKNIYEFIVFVIFYTIAWAIFDSTVISIVAGVIGAFLGKFISKVNGFFIDKIIDHLIVNENDGIVNAVFTLKATYKAKPVVLFGSYSANKAIDNQTLSTLLYTKFNDIHYVQVLKSGVAKITVGLKEGTVEIELKNRN